MLCPSPRYLPDSQVMVQLEYTNRLLLLLDISGLHIYRQYKDRYISVMQCILYTPSKLYLCHYIVGPPAIAHYPIPNNDLLSFNSFNIT